MNIIITLVSRTILFTKRFNKAPLICNRGLSVNRCPFLQLKSTKSITSTQKWWLCRQILFLAVCKRFDSFERGNPGKLTHKLNDKVLRPSPLEREQDKTSLTLCWQNSWMQWFHGFGRVLGDKSLKYCHQKLNWLGGVDLVHCRVNQALLWLKLTSSQLQIRHCGTTESTNHCRWCVS